MLKINQLSDLESAKLDIQNKQMMLFTAIDVQALLRILVDKQIITKEEVTNYRKEVRESPKYHAAVLYIEQTLAEIQAYENNPELRLKAILHQKLQGKQVY